MKPAFFLTLSFFVATAVTAPARAHDLGGYGETFDIAEIDLLKLLDAKLRRAEATGRIGELDRQFAAAAERHIEEPAPVSWISHTVRPRNWLYDPSLVVPQDYADQNGRVFAHRGDVINPLERLPAYNKTLIFIDGGDADEVRFALATRKRVGAERAIIILTAGAPVRLMRTQKVQIYFDQGGQLAGRFGIEQVPAVVTREGNGLRVSEVRP